MSTLQSTWRGFRPPMQKWSKGILSGGDIVRIPSLLHGSLSSDLTGQNGFLGPRRLPKRLDCYNLYNIPYSNVTPIWWGMSLEITSALVSHNHKLISVHWGLSIYCQNVHTTQCKMNIEPRSEEGENDANEVRMSSYFCCREMLRSIILSNCLRHVSMCPLIILKFPKRL